MTVRLDLLAHHSQRRLNVRISVRGLAFRKPQLDVLRVEIGDASIYSNPQPRLHKLDLILAGQVSRFHDSVACVNANPRQRYGSAVAL